jgi:hypothetical protein
MKYPRAILLLSLATCGLAHAAAAPSSPQQQTQQQTQPQQQPQSARPTRQTYSDRYSVLTQRNIFLRDRSRGSSNGSTTGPTTSSTQPARRSPEETLLLRGIVVEEGEVRAYFEDMVDFRMVRVAEGETIARGRIAGIGLDAVEYEPNDGGGGAGSAGRRTLVMVGHDLTGKVSPLDGISSDSAAAMATTGPVMPSGMEGINPNDPNLTMEQRLKLRRMQELKK